MKENRKNSSFRFSLWWSGVFLGILGAVAVQLAGLPLSPFQLPEVSGKKDCEALTAVISDPLPVSRQLRSSRSRNGVHGRLTHVRSGGDGDSSVLWSETHIASFFHSAHLRFAALSDSKNFWIDFIISALPVRAGPAA